MRAALIVAVGGAAGASARWGVGELVTTGSGRFPWATFIVNVVGCALIGVAARHLARDSELWSGLVVGGLGGLTTFSAFAIETRLLIEQDRLAIALMYVAATTVVGVGATELARTARTNG